MAFKVGASGVECIASIIKNGLLIFLNQVNLLDMNIEYIYYHLV